MDIKLTYLNKKEGYTKFYLAKNPIWKTSIDETEKNIIIDSVKDYISKGYEYSINLYKKELYIEKYDETAIAFKKDNNEIIIVHFYL
jgi:hypothetical protein